MRQKLVGGWWLVVGGLLATLAAVPARAQTPAPVAPVRPAAPAVTPPAAPKPAARNPKPGEVSTAPIKCWWKADRNAVRVGERFGVTLTCGVIEVGPITVVPATNQLEGGALALTPFDVVSSVRRDDVVSPPWRYFQFEYVLRVLSDGFFGQDVNIPALTVTYNLKAAGGESEGRDQSYILPALPMRVLSIVPRGAADIRDASDQTFALIESRRFRSSAGLVATGVFFAFALVLAGLALVAGTARFRTRTTGLAKPVPVGAMLSGSLKTLEGVQSQAAAGWTPELARRAVAALRVGGAVGLGKPVAQEFVAGDTGERPGQVTVRTGLLRPRRAMLSASTTAASIAVHLDNGSGGSERTRPTPKRRVALERIAESLRTFNGLAYGRAAASDSMSLTTALSEGTDAVRTIKATTTWPTRWMQ
jgi:hypothetical protein